jgi:hypothetical protein
VVHAGVKSWLAEGVTHLQILAVLRNDAPSPVQFVPAGSTYRIFDREGRAVATGVFTYAIPDRMAPGATGYLVETLSSLFVMPRDVARVVVVPSIQPAAEAATELPVSDLTWRSTAAGVEASGVVTNGTQGNVDDVFIAVLFFDSKNELVGAVYDVTDVLSLDRGASARFSTAYPGTGPLGPRDIARAEAIAFAVAP